MIVSKQTLLDEAAAAGFRAEILEKVFYLLALLTGISKHPFLKERVVLTGGTALNLFMFDLPRLSVDIDLNYIGSVDPDKMKAERPRLLKAIAAVCKREGLAIDHVKDDRHAATKFLLRYTSPLGRGGNLKIDLLYMYRIALWPITKRKSVQIGTQSQIDFPVQDIHELAGGKLKALLSRKASRDLFDAHLLFNEGDLEQDKLRLAFVVYGAMAMSDKDWREIKTTDVDFTKEDLDDQLIPVLRRKNLKDLGDREEWARKLVNETRESLNRLLPLTSPEKEFLDRLFDHGEIEPRILTQDEEMVERISQHPNLKWQAQKVEKYKLKK